MLSTIGASGSSRRANNSRRKILKSVDKRSVTTGGGSHHNGYSNVGDAHSLSDKQVAAAVSGEGSEHYETNINERETASRTRQNESHGKVHSKDAS